jgi:hypothetical protein
VIEALSHASDLLHIAKLLASDAAMIRDTDRHAWASHYLQKPRTTRGFLRFVGLHISLTSNTNEIFRLLALHTYRICFPCFGIETAGGRNAATHSWPGKRTLL